MRFVGRATQVASLATELGDVAASGTGKMLIVRGRRQVGKSRLFTEFIGRAGCDHVYFTAVKAATVIAQLEAFRREVYESSPSLPNAGTLFASNPASWADVFGRLR